MTSLVERVAELLKVVTPGPWIADGDGREVRACDGQMKVCDIRGWGYLTGGGALNLPEQEAVAIQTANESLIALSKTMAEALVRQAEALEAAEIALLNRDQSELDAVALRAVKRALAALSPSNTKPGADDDA